MTLILDNLINQLSWICHLNINMHEDSVIEYMLGKKNARSELKNMNIMKLSVTYKCFILH